MKKLITSIIIFLSITILIFPTQGIAREGNHNKASDKNVFIYRGIKMGQSLTDQLQQCEPDEKRICYQMVDIEKISSFTIHNLPDIGFHTNTDVELQDDNIVVLTDVMTAENAIELLKMMTSKHGKPKHFEKKIVQNKMGAKFISFFAYWKINNCTIALSNNIAEVGDGYLRIETNQHEKKTDAENKKSRKRALDKL